MSGPPPPKKFKMISLKRSSEIQMPPTRVVKPSKTSQNHLHSTPDVVPVAASNVKPEQRDCNGPQHAASAVGLDAGTVGAAGAGPAGPGPTLQQARVVSVTQAMAEGDLAANTVLSSQWFRHPECSLGVWWRMSGHLKNGYIKVDLVSASFDSAAAPPVEIALCAVQICLTQKKSSGTLSTSLPFKESSSILTVTEKERVLSGVEMECSVDGLTYLVLTMTIAYLEVPEYLQSKEPSPVGPGAMFDSQEFGAVNIVLDSGVQVLAHKAVLASQSTMLKTMFAGTMQEPAPSKLHVTGVSLDVLTTMLRYLYMGVIKHGVQVDKGAMVSLLYLAERFGLTRLKQHAELALVDFLQSAESDLLQVSMTTQADFLRQVILVRLSVLAGCSCSNYTQGDRNKEAAILTQVLRLNPDMLTEFFCLSTIAMAPIFKAFSSTDAKALLRSAMIS